MFTVAFSFHIFICVVIVALVMLQQGKGADLGIALGGNSQSIFGAAGAGTVLVRATTVAAIVLFISSIVLIKMYQSTPSIAGSAAPASGALSGSVLEGQLPSAEELAAAAAASQKSVTAETSTKQVPASESTTTTNPAPVAAPVAPVAPATTK